MLPKRISEIEMLAIAQKLEAAYAEGLTDSDIRLGRLYEELSAAPGHTLLTEPYRKAAIIFNRLLGEAGRRNTSIFDKMNYVYPV